MFLVYLTRSRRTQSAKRGCPGKPTLPPLMPTVTMGSNRPVYVVDRSNLLLISSGSHQESKAAHPGLPSSGIPSAGASRTVSLIIPDESLREAGEVRGIPRVRYVAFSLSQSAMIPKDLNSSFWAATSQMANSLALARIVVGGSVCGSALESSYQWIERQSLNERTHSEGCQGLVLYGQTVTVPSGDITCPSS